EQGDVKHFKARGINVMIALHACDTATDYAIEMGIRTGAEIIMCSPCCHKQLRPQLQTPTVLAPLLQHGIHLGQEAEMLTDGLRALLLEADGY
ncbi:methyltransferase, partial [Enterococcus faecium]|uniref:methyltransferase n=1 Tax=Enterococcus faecium TaxID=1352 RepID=UPI0010C19D6B